MPSSLLVLAPRRCPFDCGLILVECKILFTTTRIGRLNNEPMLSALRMQTSSPQVVILYGDAGSYIPYGRLLHSAQKQDPYRLHRAEMRVLPYSVCNLQFTSGTTGRPKAAMLTHQSVSCPIPNQG